MMTIDDALLQEFKRRMRISYDLDDENLRDILSSSYAMIQSLCGRFDYKEDRIGRTLTLECARYIYNDDTEFFQSNFKKDIQNFSIVNKKKELISNEQ